MFWLLWSYAGDKPDPLSHTLDLPSFTRICRSVQQISHFRTEEEEAFHYVILERKALYLKIKN